MSRPILTRVLSLSIVLVLSACSATVEVPAALDTSSGVGAGSTTEVTQVATAERPPREIEGAEVSSSPEASVSVATPETGATVGRAEADTWPMFRFDLHNTGFNPFETTAAPPLKLKWQFDSSGKI